MGIDTTPPEAHIGYEPLGEWFLSPYLPIIGPDEDFILNMKKIIFYKFTTMHNHRLSI